MTHRSFPILAATIAALSATTLSAQDMSALVPATRAAPPPEAVLVPIRVDGRVAPGAGWILAYRNGPSGADTPDIEIDERRVSAAGTDGAAASAVIRWEIQRTRNGDCTDAEGGPCPDTIRVIEVPDGFLAIPEEAEVGEGKSLRLYIVPMGVS